MRFRKVQFCSGLLLALVCGVVALAQNATGSISGTVTDPNNEVIANATVTVTNKATGIVRKVATRGSGTYSVENLMPGVYEVIVEAQGFATQLQTLPVEVGNTTTGNFSMTVGVTSQTVEVAGASPIINTSDTTVGGVVNRDRVENLPLNGRSFLSVAALEPGVNITYAPNSAPRNANNFFQVSIDGASQRSTVISVDGARVNDRLTGGTSQNFSAETVQEFQISTLDFDLSSGTVSAEAVNIVSRTGANDLHGSGSFFFRDHNMAAFPGLKRPCDPTAFNPLCDLPGARERLEDPFFVRRQYGGTVGGPIKKDKLFFFANYERNDQVGARAITFVDPLLFGYNHIARQPSKGRLAGLRLDYTINQKHNAFLRASLDNNNGVSGNNLESSWFASDNFSYQTQMGLTSAFSAKLVNDFRFSYSYFRNRLAPPTQAQCERIGGDPTLCFGLNGPLIILFGMMRIGTNQNVPMDRHPRAYQWTDNVNWTTGNHRARFGGNWEHSNNHGTWSRTFAGTFLAFSPTTTQIQNPAIYKAIPTSLKTGYTGPRPTFADMLAYLPAARAQLTADILSRFNGQDLSIRGVELTKTVRGTDALDAVYNTDSSVTPYTFHVNVGAQREVVRNLAVSVDYVIRREVHFGAFEGFFPDLNRWNDFAPGYTLGGAGAVNQASLVRTPVIPACVGAQSRDPKAQCSLGPIQYGLPGILSRYSALQVKVDKRFSDSFQFTGAYALSRYTTFSSITNNNNLYEGFGISGANPRHRFTFSGIWDLPKFKGDRRFLLGLLNGWQLSTLMEMRAGNPVSVTLPGSLDIDGDGTFTFRLPGTKVSSFGHDLNADDIRKLVDQYNATFPAPKDTPLTGIPVGPQRDAIGTALPYIILPPRFQNDDSFLTHDLRVTRSIRITEKVRLNLIGEGFNIFNIANLTGYSGTLDAYVRPVDPTATNPHGTPGSNPDFTFGQPTGRVSPIFGTGGPRAFQLAARLNF